MTKNRLCSVDAHFDDGAGTVLQSVLPIKVAKNSIMTDYNLSEVWFPSLYDQRLLTLCERSFSWWGREGIAICFAYKGSLKLLYNWLQHIRGVIFQDAWPKIVNPPLTLIVLWLYSQYGIIYFGTVNHSHWFGCHCGIFVDFLLDHYVVL